MSLISVLLDKAVGTLSTDAQTAKGQLGSAHAFAAVLGGYVILMQNPAVTAHTQRFMIKASDGKRMVRGFGATPNDALVDARRLANR